MKTYHEKNLVINNREIFYSGPFRADELFRTVNKVLEARSYIKREKKTEEQVQPGGRTTFIELRPFKEKTPEVTLMLKIKLLLQNVREIHVEKAGTKQKMQQGDITVALDAWMLTDYEHHWQMQPLTYFLRGMINKFLYKFPEERSRMAELVDDAGALTGAIKALFKSYGGEEQRRVSEEEVKRKVAEEMIK